jgi:prophage antirepressor-like protein
LELRRPLPLRAERGEPWFRAGDVCAVLDLSNTSQALAGLDEDEKGIRTAETPGGNQNILHVPPWAVDA